MAAPTSYDLLKEIQNSVNRLEDKMDDKFEKYELSLTNRISCVEIKTAGIEREQANMMGKVSILGSIAGGIMGMIFTIISGLIQKRI